MRTILRLRWWIAAALVVVTAALFLLSPNLSDLAADEESFQLPDDVTSQEASEILEKAGAGGETLSLVLELEKPLEDTSEKAIKEYIADVKSVDNVSDVQNPFEREELTDLLVSENEKVVLVPVSVEGTEDDAVTASEQIRKIEKPADMDRYVTGNAVITNDIDQQAQEGLKTTEGITVVLIFVLLLIVFRAVVTPFVPLLTVGLTYLMSQSIIAFLADGLGFPISTYTQVFLVAVLFGIGTDYCILLLSRYKEELGAGHDIHEAIVNTYKTAGKTLLYSGLAVLVGFSAIGFADFAIYQSAVGVAVGILVLLIVLYTLMPFFMAVLKEKLFWPSKKAGSHSDNRLWKVLGRFSIYRPLLSIIVVAVVTVPFIWSYDNAVSYNNTDENSAGSESLDGLHVIEEAFGMGDALPLEIVIDADSDMVTDEYLAAVESLSRTIAKSAEVDEVRSVTRPVGSVIDELYIDNQMEEISNGIGDARSGLRDVQKGLDDIQSGLQSMNNQIPSGSSGGGSLQEAAAGLGQVNEQIGGISQRLQQTGDVATAAQQLAGVQQGLSEIQAGLNQGTEKLAAQQSQVGELASGLDQLNQGVKDANQGVADIEDGLKDAEEFTKKISEAAYTRGTGIYVPDEFLENDDFQQAVDQYTFADGKGMTIDVALKADPYSLEAIDAANHIKELVAQETLGTPLEDATIAYSGVPSINSDLKEVSSGDFTNSIIIIMTGLFIILIILLRSLFQPIFIMGGLLLTYFTSLGVAEMIFVNGFDYPGLMWPVPFFSFVMLTALGVDYSIFLFDRYREERALGVREGLMKSMVKMGTVIITAAIILSGTFAAMLPSGVLTLIQVATVVITGLMLFGLVILPLFIPAVVSVNDSDAHEKERG
ncbi:MMPL family transporter [Bacillus piscicola]|uniref:MMPL family transporter n=1 Tax=Bacillus piscicola TaxID=1632684 RepID=UPI001F098221|nr:MMPL family transporter [Bacillus piscicola]